MKKYLCFVFICMFIMTSDVYARRGCCSHHGGVVGCTSFGMQLCRDGTSSPTCGCESSVVSGCTNKNAINYNSRANTNNGSCRFKKTIYVNETILYSTKYIEDTSLEYGKEVIDTIGLNGIKHNSYEVISDSLNTEISKNLIDSEITKEPVTQVIRRNTTIKSDVTSNKEVKEDNNTVLKEDTSSSSDTVIGTVSISSLVGILIYALKKSLKK